MKSLFFAFFVILFVSCDSDEDPIISKDYTVINEQEIESYIAANDISAGRTDSGLYYYVEEEGEGTEITASSDVTIRFKSYFTDGSILDEVDGYGYPFNVQQQIIGLREGLQMFREGGSGMLIVPSHLAFGSDDYREVPGGSVLIFEIEVIDIDVENDQEILDYISDNSLNALPTESGLYYVIDEEGTGEQPTESSNVTVAYKGYFTDGTTFDESDENGISFNLSQVIPGWTEGMKYFKEGGSGKLLVPSSLAYGRFGVQGIPGGAVLVFEVNLKEVN